MNAFEWLATYFWFLFKMLEKHLRNNFLLYMLIEVLQIVHEINGFWEVFVREMF